MTRMITMHLLLFVAAVAQRSSSSESLDPIVFVGDIPQCAGIEYDYPFGIPGFSPYLEGFQIICNPEGGNMTLQLGTSQRQHRILNVSLHHGYIRAEISLIPWRCDRGFGPMPDPTSFSLEGTPYTFNDTSNKFTVIGCDALVLLHIPSLNVSTGCASFCVGPNSIGSYEESACSGVGCCQASIPRGMKSFRLDFNSIRNLSHANVTRGLPCSRAFVVEQEQFVFSADLLTNPYTSPTPSVVLDWAIGNKNCSEALARNDKSYACRDNSNCLDSPAGGYRCVCKDGYSGNPYRGCKDIDECGDTERFPCVRKCINKEGSFHCPCPFGTTGDGRKDGEGCKRVQTLEIVLSVGLCLLFLLLLASFCSYWLFEKRRAIQLKQKHFLQNGGLLLQQHISSREATARIFSVDELEKATDNFNEDQVLGRGGYGTVYKGVLQDQRVVAIKKAKLLDQTQIEQFINEVVILSQINHLNVVKLLGCCLETQVPLLVYEFISNGSLFYHIHHGATAMSWENRLRISVETAAALAYLHSASPLPIIHRDIKSANILLDENFTAKVADFGASRLVPYDQTHVTTVVQGTLGYLDPDYFLTSVLTEKSDVYSFGVVLVELLTREKPVAFCRSEDERSLVSYFVSLVEQSRLAEVVDRTVREAGERHLLAVALLARRCLSAKPEERPRMKDVEVELDALWRLMKQHSSDKPSQGGETGDDHHHDATKQFIKEAHGSTSDSSTSRQYSMESHLLSSVDLPR